MRRSEFDVQPAEEAPSGRHTARSRNFYDQSIFTYAHANKNWWGYA